MERSPFVLVLPLLKVRRLQGQISFAIKSQSNKLLSTRTNFVMAAKFSNKFIGRKTSTTLRKVKLIYAFVLSLVLRPQAGADMGHNQGASKVQKMLGRFWLRYVCKINNTNKNLEEIQDQIAICAKREIKVQERNKSLKKEIKVLKRKS